MKRVVSFVGFSKSGKTALISDLVSLLSKKGYRIGVIKHTSKDFQVDREGKDSWRVFSSGADVIVLSPTKMAFQKHLNHSLPLRKLSEFFADYDLIITEGFKGEFEKAVAIARNPNELEELLEHIQKERKTLEGVIAVVISKGELDNFEIPTFKPTEIEELAEFIISTLGLLK